MTEVERTVEFDAAPDDVWDALTDPALLEEWFDGGVDVDLRPGGRLRVTADGDVREGVIDDLVPARRLTFTWSGDDDHPGSTVELELEPTDDGCTLHVREILVDDVFDGVELVGPAEPAFPIGFRPPSASIARRGEALALARS
jgi:uncharacterized protein YndB with AHSA1/START domain